MIETIAIIVGVAALVISFMACITLLLLKKNVKDILQKDALIFDENFQAKKAIVLESFSVVDSVLKYGKNVINNPSYYEKAKNCYNGLICVVTDSLLIDAYMNIALNIDYPINADLVTTYKILCRKDIGLKTKSGTLLMSLPAAPNRPVVNKPEQPSSTMNEKK